MSDRLAKLESLLAADPRDGFVLYGLAQEYGKRGEHARALEFYERLLAVEPGHCYAFFFKARSLAELGRVDEAVAVAQAGVKVASAAGDAKAMNELSGLKMELQLR